MVGQSEYFQREEGRYESQNHFDCHRTFKTSDYEKYKNINPELAEGTCQWVLTHPKYIAWRDSTKDDLLWITADPGCGKSVLSRSLVDTEFKAVHSVCYFFFKDNDEQDNLVTALCALIHQLLSRQPDLLRHAIPTWEKNGKEVRLAVEELWRILRCASTDPKAQNVICVLDALDECRQDDRYHLISQLSEFYQEASKSTRTQWLKFVITSRPYEDIESQFKGILSSIPTLRIRGEYDNEQISREIDGVIRTRVANLAKLVKLSGEQQLRIEQTLLGMQHRTYLWLHLSIEGILENCRNNIWQDQELVELLPKSVEDAYETILNKVRRKDIAMQILKIVVGARRPLSVGEMAQALSIDTSVDMAPRKREVLADNLEEKIRQQCGLFVLISQSKIYLIHQTAKEFLLGSNPDKRQLQWKHCLNPIDVETNMARICIMYLSQSDLHRKICTPLVRKGIPTWKLRNDLSDAESFVAYSAEHWPSHLRQTELDVNDRLMIQAVKLLDTVNSSIYRLWYPIFWMSVKYGPEVECTSFHLAAIIGNDVLLRTLRKSVKQGVDEKDAQGSTPLMRASEFGHLKVVRTFLEEATAVNATNPRGETAISFAASYGFKEVVELLLENGAELTARVLEIAAMRGNGDIVKWLVDEKGVKVTNKVVELFAIRGDKNMIEWLVNEKGGVVTAKAIENAVYRNHRDIVMWLVEEKGIKVTSRMAETAASEGHKDIIEWLIEEKGVEATTGIVESAAGRGHKDIAKWLIEEKGVEATAEMVERAMWDGHKDIIEWLIDEKGVKVTTRMAECAAWAGQKDIAEWLIEEKGIEATIGMAECAVWGCHKDIVEWLIDEKGVELTTGIVENAVGEGYKDTIEWLIDEKGVKVTTAMVERAALSGYKDIVEWLIEEKGVEATIGTMENAVSGGHKDTIKWLIEEKGVEVTTEMVESAVLEGHKDTVKWLIEEKCVEVTTKMLESAALGGHKDIAEWLIEEKGVEVTTEAVEAARKGYSESMDEWLVVKGGN